MSKIKYNSHTIELYDSIQDLPITRFQKYNLNLMIDAGIGSDVNDFNQRINTISALMTRDVESAHKELVNIQQNLQFIMSQTSPVMNSFVVLIKKIDGREITDDDLTDEGIKSIIEELGRKKFKYMQMSDFLTVIKKKFDFELETFFPKRSDNVVTKEFYSKLRHRTSLVLKSVIESNEEIENKINEISEFFLSKIKPKQYHGHSGLEVQAIKNFEQTCILLLQHNVTDTPKKMTTLSFFQALETLHEQLKKQKERSKK